jgi:cytidylate kinase
LLRVLVTASKETRVKRVAESSGSAPSDAAHAVDASDKARADYFKRFYHVEEELPTHYDVVFNTDVLDIEQALAAILSLDEGQPSP